MKTIVIDLDKTLTLGDHKDYSLVSPNLKVIKKLEFYKEKGFKIVVFTARNMRTFQGNVDLIKKNTLPIIIDWLNKHAVCYDEIIVGKPWCGNDGFYVDDRAIRPSEFIDLSPEEINHIINETT